MHSIRRPSPRLGTQSWNYPDWAGVFYPEGARGAELLALYARIFDTVEVDSTFYAVPPESTVEGWIQKTPEDFLFAVKVPREITHERRLRNSETLLAEFLDRIRPLGKRLGPLLVQLGPDFGPDEREALHAFLPLLPTDLRFAVELRDPGWFRRELLERLTDHRIALALSDGPWVPREWLLALVDRPTADFHYVRWMGNREFTSFSEVQVDRSDVVDLWSRALLPVLDRGMEVFGYVNNHFAGHAPASVRDLLRRLGARPTDPRATWEQTVLF